MPSSAKILILADENVNAKLVKFLSDKGIDIKYAVKGIKNSELFTSARKEGRILLAHDADFLNTVLYPPKSCPGIIMLAVHPPVFLKLKASMSHLLEEFSGDIKNKLIVVRETGIEIVS